MSDERTNRRAWPVGVAALVAASLVAGAVVQFGGAATPHGGHVVSQQDGPIAGEVNLSAADASIESPNGSPGPAAAGDVNGDGTADLFVGVVTGENATGGVSLPAGENATSGAAALFVGPVASGAQSTGTADLLVTSEDDGDLLGRDVAMGDLDGDGLADLVVGAPRHEAVGDAVGAVFVFYGAESLDGEVDVADADVTVVGTDAGDGFGAAVAVVPNGSDGADLVVGARFADAGGADAGAAYRFGPAALPDGAGPADATAAYLGETAGAAAGAAVAHAGDVDGDGDADVLVGAPNATDANGTAVGAAYLLTADQEHAGETSLGAAALELVGAAAGDAAGFDVTAAGDVDDDGHGDVLVGAPFDDAGGADAGAAYLVLGGPNRSGVLPLPAADATFAGAGAGDAAGWSVAGAGDVTCDGADDVLVGAPGAGDAPADAGRAYVVDAAGATAGTTNLSTAAARLTGAREGDRAGSSVVGVGDVGGDGDPDVLVAAPRNGTGGSAHLLFAECPDSDTATASPTEPPTGTPTGTPTATATAAPTPTPTDAPASTPTATPTPTDTPASTPTETPTDAPTPTATPTAEPAGTVEVTGGCLGPDGAIFVAGDATQDDPITVTAFDEDGAAVGKVILSADGDTDEIVPLPDGTYTVEAETDSGQSVPVSQPSVTVDCGSE